MVVNGRECQQIVAIILGIAEGYQALVLTAVVPVQLMLTQGEGDAVVENALHIIYIGLFLVNGVGSEETGRRHLLAVAHDNECLATGNGSNGLAGGHL